MDNLDQPSDIRITWSRHLFLDRNLYHSQDYVSIIIISLLDLAQSIIDKIMSRINNITNIDIMIFDITMTNLKKDWHAYIPCYFLLYLVLWWHYNYFGIKNICIVVAHPPTTKQIIDLSTNNKMHPHLHRRAQCCINGWPH